ncbi:MAG TPA: pirin family protein [Polyangiaceae bacterium]|nr:pirin family protein [Polyangiaceae bacterium]
MSEVQRREVLKLIAASGLVPGCSKPSSEPTSQTAETQRVSESRSPVLNITPLPVAPSPWPTQDPFLFCVHHDDRYPRGNAQFGPTTTLEGRQMGSDFSRKDGWSMYHGRVVPGFPQHPHRGFETVTVVRRGLLDHSDSLGAAARYGHGDVQWLTAGSGIQHAEMFPLLQSGSDNPLELFQIWMNLPRANKFVPPYFSMLWSKQIPNVQLKDSDGRAIEISLKAGKLGDAAPPPPPPNSWAADAKNEVAIWSIKMEPQARWVLPQASAGLNRTLYFFHGSSVAVGGQSVPRGQAIELVSDLPAELINGADESELLLLQGRPIGEPKVQHGPFVMNTQQEIREAYDDYRRTQFGGWPWPDSAPVHGPEGQRFARFIDGRTERPS